MGYEWLALIAAMTWAISSMISVVPSRHLGTFAYSRWRMACVTVMLGAAGWLSGGWHLMPSSAYFTLMLSGFIGIFIGDTALFACLNRVGPRRAGLLFSCHALFSALIGIWLFGESLWGWKLVGALLVFGGVILAVSYGRHQPGDKWEAVHGTLGIAVVLGLIAALCQSLGGIIAKPLMAAGIDPIAGSAIRMATALSAHLVLWGSGARIAKAHQAITWAIFMQVLLNGFLAMGVGMTLIMVALKYGDVGMVGLLSSTSPVMILPLLWLFTRRCPSLPSWIGALLAVLGTALILTSQ